MEIESISGNTCTACAACMNICPKKAISMPEDKYGFYQPQINPALCVNCGLCDSVCPALHTNEVKPTYKAYCGYSTVHGVRVKSSSGGLFRALADRVLERAGVVYGAAFNYGQSFLRLEHCSTENTDVDLLQKSKYVQSWIGLTYKDVKTKLQSGKEVLFVGTPCQVDGLLSFLGKKEYPLLLTVDFICHGVPPMALLRDHLKEIGFKKMEEITKIDFRPKKSSWVDDLVVEGKKNHYSRYYIYDSYFKGFDKTYSILRKSCFQCSYCNGANRKADITLADFWGVIRTDIKIDYRPGLSLLLCYTSKGETALKNLKNVRLEPVNIEDTEYVYDRERATYYPHTERDKFFDDYANHGYKYAVANNGLKTSRKKIVCYNLKQAIKKIIK